VSFSEEGADFDPCVSRDGSRLVFASTQHRTTADLYIKRINSKTVTQLTSGGSDNVMPDISPDGERIAFATNRNGSWDIFVMPVTGGQAVQITSDAADELHPSWSPDGKDLVFCKLGETSGRWEMWVAPVQNPATPSFIGYGLFPRWCPVAGTGAEGSDKILFQLSRERGNRTFGLWTLDYGHGMASNPTEVASEPTKAFINPTWSPDGQWICYAEIPSVGNETASNGARSGTTTSRLPSMASLWMIGADGTGKVSLVGGNGASLMPTWSSDGSIYFVSNRGGAENIWSLNSTGAIKAAKGPAANPTDRPVAGANEERPTEGH
jgi:TolB protein